MNFLKKIFKLPANIDSSKRNKWRALVLDWEGWKQYAPSQFGSIELFLNEFLNRNNWILKLYLDKDIFPRRCNDR